MRSSRAQRARENRKQSLLTPTEAKFILIGQWKAYQPPELPSLPTPPRPIFMTSHRNLQEHDTHNIHVNMANKLGIF